MCDGVADALHRTGCAVWFGPNDERNLSRVMAATPGRIEGLLHAVELAVEVTQPTATLHVVSPSPRLVTLLGERVQAMEDAGWGGSTVAATMKEVVAKLRGRGGVTTFRYDDGTEDERVALADELATAGTNDEYAVPWRASPPLRCFLRDGVKLASMTQRQAYVGIRAARRTVGDRAATSRLTDVALGPQADSVRAKRRLWTGLRNRDVSRQVKEFLWKALHNAHKVGSYWTHIPQMQHRAMCPRCDTVESMEHILVRCSAPAVETGWGLLQALLSKIGVDPLPKSMSTALSCHVPTLTVNGKPAPCGLQRLVTIAMTETVHLLWKLRCEWVIGNGAAPQALPGVAVVTARWHSMLQRRLRLDQALAGLRGGLPLLTLHDTWVGLVEDPQPACDTDLTRLLLPGVLVGRLTPEIALATQGVQPIGNG
ncbi:hypothetical protein C8Q76DRAFT_666658 [Earliella scabrosa]|nr:hypothetical protein C8Q76DRAFT_666658 [Earliella scabrosa]